MKIATTLFVLLILFTPFPSQAQGNTCPLTRQAAEKLVNEAWQKWNTAALTDTLSMTVVEELPDDALEKPSEAELDNYLLPSTGAFTLTKALILAEVITPFKKDGRFYTVIDNQHRNDFIVKNGKARLVVGKRNITSLAGCSVTSSKITMRAILQWEFTPTYKAVIQELVKILGTQLVIDATSVESTVSFIRTNSFFEPFVVETTSEVFNKQHPGSTN